MQKYPESISLANLPTKIEKLERLTKQLGGPEIWIKRDDQTGTELSGNKVRKLEFSVKEALSNGCDYLITCGAIQSNHARATAAVGAKLGLGVILLLAGDGNVKPEGNHFLDLIFGAEIRFVTGKEYGERRTEIMESFVEELKLIGHKGYIIPEGASNGIGSFGYLKAMQEIHMQEAELGFEFDCIVSATGSGGTYAGLLLGDFEKKKTGRILGFAVGKDTPYFNLEVSKIIVESGKLRGMKLDLSNYKIDVNDEYIGKGYAKSSKEELEFIVDFAKLEGILLDPVYTGKAMYGLVEEIKKGNLKDCKRILFIHTGGLFGLLGKTDEIMENIERMKL